MHAVLTLLRSIDRGVKCELSELKSGLDQIRRLETLRCKILNQYSLNI